MSLFDELKRRNVFRVTIAYVAMAWLLIQVADIILNNFAAPPWAFRVLLLFLLIGLPLAAFLAWAFELTPEGLKRESEVEQARAVTRRPGRLLNVLIVGLLALGAGFFAYDRFGPSGSADNAGAETHPLAVSQNGPMAAESPAAANRADRIALLDKRPAVAVLPFDNLSPDPEQAFFADGLAEDLITRLSSWRAFPVIARNSSFQFRGSDVDLQQASAALGARYLVEGSVRRAGSRIRVTAQLIDVSTGEHVWADSYDREVGDVFVMQDEISAAIAAPLVGDLNRAEAERARQTGTENLEAWSLYQLGLQHADRFTRQDLAEGRRLLHQAMERDPRFAGAPAKLALANLWEVILGWNESPEKTIAASLELARHAESLDPRNPSAQAALGWAYLMSGAVDNGLAATRRAVQLNPSSPEAWGWLSWVQLLAGDLEECIAAAERTQRLAPLSAYSSIVNDNLSQAYWQLGRYAEGLEAARRLEAEMPGYYLAHVYVAMNAVGLGRVDEARAAIDAARRSQPDLSLELVQGTYGVERPEVDARRNAALRQAGLE